jgi:copper chaperone
MIETITLKVTGMTCGGCENAVKRGLGRLDGVGEVTASHVNERVTVAFDPARITPDRIKARVAEIGYTVAD